MELFAKATRDKVRFQGTVTNGTKTITVNGSVEVLWNLLRSQLNELFQEYSRQSKALEADRLMGSTSANAELQLKMDLIRYVYDIKTAEAAQRENRKAAEDEIRYLEGLLETQQKQADLSLTPAEIAARIAAKKAALG